MREVKRIQDFCNQLASIWEEECPDWRFGQLMCNVLGSDGKDPWFKEEPEMMELFQNYFKKVENKT